MDNIERLCDRYGFRPWLGVLCGWDWAASHTDPLPPVTIEVSAPGVRHSMTINDHASTGRIMKSITQGGRR